MSYILDALRKADAERERERGAVPSLYAPPAPDGGVEPGDGDAARAPGQRSPLRWVVLALLVLLTASLFWQWLGAEAPPPVVVHVAATDPAPPLEPDPAPPPAREVLPESVPPPVAEARPAEPEPPEPEPRQAAPAPAPAPAPVVARPRPVPTPAPPRAAEPAAPAPPAARPAPTARELPPVAAPAAVAPPATALPQLHELPENLRRGIPPLQVGGAMYSEDPGKRMVVLNGQVFHEGDRPVPELTLEQIRLKSAVFSLPGGQRFVLNY